MKEEFKKLRGQFRDWYGAISVAEIMTNRNLIQKIESLDRQLSLMVS